MIAATSKFGFIADKHGNVESWTSDADKNFFNIKRRKSNLYIFGSGTYDAIKPRPEPGTLKVVMTRDPARYSRDIVTDQLHFESLAPVEIVEKYKTWGNALLLGGGVAYEKFLTATDENGNGIVNEAYITYENTATFTEGIPLLASGRPFSSVANIQAQTTAATHLPDTTITHYILK